MSPEPEPPPAPAREGKEVAAAVPPLPPPREGGGAGRSGWIMLVKRVALKAVGRRAQQGVDRPSVYHAVVVIFLEFFAWGLLTMPVLTVLHETFSHHTFLMNGLICGLKGFLSFLSAPLIGALSDAWGRKYFLLLTVFFTCAPFPVMRISPWWFFAMISVSGIFSVTYSVILAYVADVTQEHERITAYGLSLNKVRKDSTVLLICLTVLLSYMPEAGQYSSFFLYLQQIIGFGSASIAAFIAMLGVLSVIAQTVFLRILVRSIGNKNTVLLGLGFQVLQLAWYGFGSQSWMMWAAGAIAAMSSVTFPAISTLVSRNAGSDQQGIVQGIITGVRGLCSGLGPVLYGFIFFLFHMELDELPPDQTSGKKAMLDPSDDRTIIPGPPFLVGACIVLLALLSTFFIPEHSNSISSTPSNNLERRSEEDLEPLLQDSSV
ncbi:hippocampus abundant transcript-like protein 1 isoform X5 [Colius striatus]|uniref:hippocampus abundant transcript-like protein 1 isoform X5 n=1 Tax=Colius striatus TaxID=57412 RepID=UPI002B1D511E|nr:hippocampus abundant transcript-like protein 1 isoform X5 [Colius striatus]